MRGHEHSALSFLLPQWPRAEDARPGIFVAAYNPSDAGALQRRLANRWEEGLDLAGADLRRRDIAALEEELTRCTLQGADLSGARLVDTHLEYSNLRVRMPNFFVCSQTLMTLLRSH